MNDENLTDFEIGLLESITQMKHSEFAAVHTPEVIKARRGRPVGSVRPTHKCPTMLRMDADALARWRASGKGWQTRAAELLAKHTP